MLRFSKKVDYGLIALKHIAMQGNGGVVSAREIAQTYYLPPDLLAKILQNLARGGIIRSQAGSGGGYRMARDPSDVSLKDIVEAIDNSMQLVGCGKGNAPCLLEPHCTIKNTLLNVEKKLHSFFDTVKLNEI